MTHGMLPPRQGLYDPANEHDACGVGFVANVKGRKSHEIVRQGLKILENLTHRGAVGADPLAGDGAGILMQIPDAFLREECAALGITLPAAGDYGVGAIFLPQQDATRDHCLALLESITAEEGQTLLGWRDVPTDNSGLGEGVKAVEPVVRQLIIGRGDNCADTDAFERKLFVIRKRAENAIAECGMPGCEAFYVPSMSCRTLSYKGMLLSNQVDAYFTDLKDDRLTSALALVHQRFSTNTFPSWDLAHPFRMIAHNGEINTVRGNINWMNARRHSMASELFGDDLGKLWPLIAEGQSDSACFDNALELLVTGGYSMSHAMMMLIPEAWAGNPLMDDKRRAFYEYHAALMEPWDGPAAVAFTDGRQIGATLDRNGLRPARYLITDDDLVVMASEMGVLDIPEERIVKKWRLQPGKMFLIDMEEGRIIDDEELKAGLADARPYQDWLANTQILLKNLPGEVSHPARPAAGLRLYPGRHQVPDDADGRDRPGSDRLHGCRQSAGGAVQQAETTGQLFQAELRPGHQPADRPDPRGAGDVAGVADRTAAQPARPRVGRRAHAPGGAATRPEQHRYRTYPPYRGPHRRRIPHPDTGYLLPGGAGCRGHAGRGGRPLPGGRAACRTGRSLPTGCQSPPCWQRRQCITTWCAPGCAPSPGWWSRRAPPARSIISPPWPVTGPRRSTPTLPSNPWRPSANACRRTSTRRRSGPATSRPSARDC
jgi:glutamate synthase domain-containing protein 1